MPAINPSLLERQISAALAHDKDPEQYARGLQEIVEFYADRTRRSTKASDTLIFGKVLRVPRPVLQAITRSVRVDENLSTMTRLASSRLLWEQNYRETRMIAISLISDVDQTKLAERLEKWANDTDDDEVLLWMAQEGLVLGKRQPDDMPWTTLKGWLCDPSMQVQRLALFGLLDLVTNHRDDTHLPEIFRLLRGSARGMPGASLAAMSDLLVELALRSPHETAQYLIDELQSNVDETRPIARNCLSVLPPGMQSEVQQAI